MISVSKRRSKNMAACAAALLLNVTELDLRFSLCNYFRTYKARLFFLLPGRRSCFFSHGFQVGKTRFEARFISDSISKYRIGIHESSCDLWILCLCPCLYLFSFHFVNEVSQDPEILKFSFQDQVRQEQGKVKLRGKIAAEQVRCFPISCLLLVPSSFSMYIMTVLISYPLFFFIGFPPSLCSSGY